MTSLELIHGWSALRSEIQFCYRKATKVSQKLPSDALEGIVEFNTKIIELLQEHKYQPDAIVNIDETGPYFDTYSLKTLELKVTLIFVTTTGSEKQRLTCLIGVNAPQITLSMFTILKGKKLAKDIENLENPNLLITETANAWCTEESIWIDSMETVFSSICKISSDHGQISSHKLQSVLSELSDCKTDVVFIPKGLTDLLQPCDVPVNKPFKERIRKSWESYMLSQASQDSGNSLTEVSVHIIGKAQKRYKLIF